VSEEDRIEELCCHGDAMGKLDDALDENIMEGDMLLKAKIIKDREKHIERIPFKEKKDKLENILKQM
jgi:hypothetical protein